MSAKARIHKMYPKAKIGLVMYMRFGTPDMLCYSIRSYDPNVRADDLAKRIKGDGNAVAAGGRIEHVFPIPF